MQQTAIKLLNELSQFGVNQTEFLTFYFFVRPMI